METILKWITKSEMYRAANDIPCKQCGSNEKNWNHYLKCPDIKEEVKNNTKRIEGLL